MNEETCSLNEYIGVTNEQQIIICNKYITPKLKGFLNGHIGLHHIIKDICNADDLTETEKIAAATSIAFKAGEAHGAYETMRDLMNVPDCGCGHAS